MTTKITPYKVKKGEVRKVILLYSGGLDSSIILKLIQDEYGAEVITLTGDVGQTDDLEAIRRKALSSGAIRAYVKDLKREFADKYLSRAIKSNALYEGKYPLISALSRYPMARSAVELAESEGADACAHGCTGKGNSQVRFDLTIMALAPNLKIIAPIREHEITRDEALRYAQRYGIQVPVSPESIFSVDENLWGRGVASGVLEDPDEEPPKDILRLVTPPEDAPNKPEYINLRFERGIPIALNGHELELYELIIKLNELAGRNGVGLIDHVEDRVVGLKSRDFYECPAALTIIEAHRDLEKFTSTSQENAFKEVVDSRWTQLAYSGLWYDPLMDALNSFVDVVNEKVTGDVRLKLYKGTVRVVGRRSPYALYDKTLTTYMTSTARQMFNQQASTGFIELFGFQTRAANILRRRQYDKDKRRDE